MNKNMMLAPATLLALAAVATACVKAGARAYDRCHPERSLGRSGLQRARQEGQRVLHRA